MPTNSIQLSTGNSSGAKLRTFSATENSSVVHYQPAWVVFGANSTSPTVVTSAAGLPVAQQGTWILGANSGVDVGDVTINNSSAAPVPIDIHVNGRQVEGSTGNHTSTGFGLLTRLVGDSSVVVKGNTTSVMANSSGAITAANPLQVALADSTATVTIRGNTTAVIQGNSTVAPLAGSLWTIQGNSTVAPLGGSVWTVQGNTTAVLSSQVPISSGGLGGTIDTPLWATPLSNFPDSTRVTLKLSSTTPSTLISSGASTRISVIDLDVTGTEGQTLFSLYDNTTGGTLRFQEVISSGGGGFGRTFTIPIRTAAGAALVAQIDPASTGVYINAGGFRST